MNKVECPCCGAKLRVVVEAASALSDLGAPSRPAKSEYAAVRDTPPAAPKPLVIPKVEPKKYRTDTDTGAFRQALYDAGFVDQAERGSIFNDKGQETRRLKLWFARSVVNAEDWQQQALKAALLKYFGKRLIMCGSYANTWDKRCGRVSYIVRLEL